MDFVFNLLSSQGIIAVVQLLVGKWLKDNPKVPNTLIPFFTFIAAVLGYQFIPVAAQAATAVGTVVGPVASVFGLALFQNLLVTGTHSTLKNTVLPAGKAVLVWLLKSLVKE